MASVTPRGISINNPMCVRHGASVWQGASEVQNDEAFVTFKSAQFGIRAGIRTLLTYQNAHGLKSIRDIISRWAPPSENDTEAYIKHVAEVVGVEPDAPIDVDSVGIMRPLICAIITHEQGQQPYSNAVLMEALRMAGVSDTKPKPLIKSKQALTAAGSVIASGGAAVAALNETVVAPVSRALTPYAEQNQHVGQVIGILAGIGAALAAATVIFRAVQAKKTGL